MSSTRIKIYEVRATGEFDVTIEFNSVAPALMLNTIETFGKLFEIEMYSSVIEELKNGLVVLTIKTKNKEKVNQVKKIVTQQYFNTVMSDN